MNLPEGFRRTMRELLGAEAVRFFEAYGQRPFRGVSVNVGKISVEDFLAIAPFRAERIPWSETGLLIADEFEPGQHPYYHAGLYYVQEPSAMLPAEMLEAQPGDVVLDACAAPGGKSMQILARLRAAERNTAEGLYAPERPFLVIASDIAESRVKAVLRNAERYGARDLILLREDARRIAESPLLGSVDRILLDAPCSGEGMFRKDDRAIAAWLENGPEHYSGIQRELLKRLASQSSAEIVYSTCTFNRTENESVAASAEETHELVQTRRIYPHRETGEGHFAARLVPRRRLIRTASDDSDEARRRAGKTGHMPAEFAEFLDRYVVSQADFTGNYEQKGEELFLLPRRTIDTEGLEVVRKGLLAGRIVRDRKGVHFWPSQALAHYLDPAAYRLRIDLALEDPRVMKYLRGETLETGPCENGYHLVCVDGYALGFASVKNGVFKNLYKQSWRVLK